MTESKMRQGGNVCYSSDGKGNWIKQTLPYRCMHEMSLRWNVVAQFYTVD